MTKYRYKVLTGDVALRVRGLVRQTCEAFEIRDSQRGSERGLHPHTGECTTGAGAQGDHEEAQGAFSEQIIR